LPVSGFSSHFFLPDYRAKVAFPQQILTPYHQEPDMKVSFVEPTRFSAGAVAVMVAEDRKLSPTALALDKQTKGALRRAMAASRFTGKKGQTLSVMAPSGTKLDRITLVGIGKPKDLDALGAEALGGTLIADANAAGQKLLTIAIDAVAGVTLDLPSLAAGVALGARLRSYRFDKYRTKEKADAKPTVTGVAIAVKGVPAAQRAYATASRAADAVFFTRDLVSEPANVIYPESLAAKCKELSPLGVKVEVLGEAAMTKLGMGAILGVGQGSARESQLVVMSWMNGPKDQKPVAFIGKGVCFDTGGISIKPAGGMEDMKWDMGGAAAVIGAMRLLASRKARVNVVGVVGLVENMPSGTAQRPGDVVKTMSGQTVEVINTDAEGRLVLADAIWYCQQKYNPQCLVDLATLTGAIIISLGHEQAGLFANDDAFAAKVSAAGKAVGEALWRMPLGEAYDKDINSDIADMKNVGSGRGAGSITAAQFIKRFVIGNTPWAHLDIAGTAWTSKDSATTPKGATAFGVRLLDRLVADNYEAK
jgi:leucyl aminopeptidase